MEELYNLICNYEAISGKVDYLIRNSKRSINLEEKTKQQIASLFGEELPLKRINKILKKNKFQGIYIAEDKDFDKVFYGGGEYLHNDTKGSFIIIPERNVYKMTILSHEMIHALIGKRLKPLCNSEEFLSIADGLEEGICEAVATAVRIGETEFYGRNSIEYYAQTKLVQQLNVLYNNTSLKKYSSFILHAILEPERTFPLIYSIYSDILENYLPIIKKMSLMTDKEVSNVGYKTAYNLLLASSLPDSKYGTKEFQTEQEESVAKMNAMSYINHLYYSLCNEKTFYNETDQIIKDIFPKRASASREERLIREIYQNYRPYIEIISDIEKNCECITRYEEEKTLKR